MHMHINFQLVSTESDRWTDRLMRYTIINIDILAIFYFDNQRHKLLVRFYILAVAQKT